MKIAYFECFSGASGDMILGALLDAGLDFDALKKELSALKLAGFSLQKERALKGGIHSTQADVVLDRSMDVESRGLGVITQMIEASNLESGIKSDAIRIFNRLGAAEAFVHGVSIEEVHFHEVGAIDAIVDIVGSVIGLNLLGVDEIRCSAINVGGGFVKTAHGILPAPAPATLELMKGLPCYSTGMIGETLTPTGAAILSTLAVKFGPAPEMNILSVGYGAGKMDLESPNVLRLVIGQAQEVVMVDPNQRVAVIETNIDDMSPELYDHVLEKVLRQGALDVSLSTIQMKKNRLAAQLQIICPESEIASMAELVFRETTSIGVRWRIEDRIVAQRSITNVETGFGVVRVKIASRNGRIVNLAPEYDDCKRLAVENDIPLKTVMLAASSKASELFSKDQTHEN